MEKLLPHRSCARRYGRAVVIGVTLVSFVWTTRNEVRAAWIPSPFGQKTASDPDRDANQGYIPVIRRLMDEAKSLEEQGNFDRALIQTERARRLSLSTANIKRQAPEFAPDVLAKYMEDLRAKKAERSGRRVAMPTTRNPRAAIEANQPKPKTQAPENTVALRGASQNSARPPVSSDEAETTALILPPAPSASDESRTQHLLATVTNASEDSDPGFVASNSDEDRTAEDQTGMSESTADTRSSISDETIEDERFEPFVTDLRSDLRESSADTEEINAVADNTAEWNGEEDQRIAGNSSDSEKEENTPADSETSSDAEFEPFAKSRQLKLRPRFETDEPILSPITDSAGSEKLPTAEGPLITPRSKSDFDGKRNREPGRIAEEVRADEFLSETADHNDSNSAKTSSRIAKQPMRSAEHPLESEFPEEQVKALKHKMDSAIALRPGELAVGATSESAPSADEIRTEAERKIESRRIRFRKMQRKPVDPNFNLAERIGKSRSKASSTGSSSVVKWRSARNEEKSAFTNEFDHKSSQLAHDLRQSLREESLSGNDVKPSSNEPSLFSLPKADASKTAQLDRHGKSDQLANTQDTGNRTHVRGTLWDNSAGPTSPGSSGSIGGFTRMMEVAAIDLNGLSKRPTDSMVEQTSFDPPAELFSRRSSANDPIHTDVKPYHPDSVHQEADQKVAGAESKSSQNPSPTSHSIFDYGPFEWPAILFGAKKSTTSSLFGAAGLALFFVGIWVARETIRSKNS